MGNFDCDFVCYLSLSRGYSRPRKSGDDGRRAPEVYVLPINVVRRAWVDEGSSQKVCLSRFDADAYFERWDLIRDFLRKRPKRARRTA
jgi:hypothetical protein